MDSANFILGTANIGQSYGINNPNYYDENASLRILNHAIKRGINSFDTAANYGVAEQLIGKTIGTYENFRVITKVPTQDSYTFEYVNDCLEKSLNNLQQKNIYGLMFHDPDINTKSKIQDISKKLLESGRVEHLGFSAYSLEAVLEAKEKNQNWTIFQVPENILDRRLHRSTEMADLARNQNSIFVRSIFLQGLILREPNELPQTFHKYKKILADFRLACDQQEVNILDLCISYASSISWSSGIVVAAASTGQLDQIIDYKFIDVEFDLFDCLPDEVLDPRLWKGVR